MSWNHPDSHPCLLFRFVNVHSVFLPSVFLYSFPVLFFFFQLLAAFFCRINDMFYIFSFRSKNVSWIYWTFLRLVVAIEQGNPQTKILSVKMKPKTKKTVKQLANKTVNRPTTPSPTSMMYTSLLHSTVNLLQLVSISEQTKKDYNCWYWAKSR